MKANLSFAAVLLGYVVTSVALDLLRRESARLRRQRPSRQIDEAVHACVSQGWMLARDPGFAQLN